MVSGGAVGVDMAGEAWAEKNGIPVVRYVPSWSKHGLYAGILRNREMAQNADALLAIWDGKSRGTANMIREAKERGLKTYVYRLEKS